MPLGNYVLLSISDTGCGMDKQVIEHLFEPFYTTKNIGQGTGLGLATVYGIVNQNKGAISVQSVPGKGSVFKIFFPWFNPKNAKKKKEIINISACGGFETILLVEDEPVILMRSLIQMAARDNNNDPFSIVRLPSKLSIRNGCGQIGLLTEV